MTENNWTSWVATSSAFAAGATYGMHKEYGSLAGVSKAFHEVIRPTMKPVMTVNQNVAQRVIRNVVQSQGDMGHLTELQREMALSRLDRLTRQVQRLNKIPGLSSAVAREWEAAKSAVLPTGMEVGGFVLSPENPLAGARMLLERSSSVYTQDVFRKFASNVEAIIRTGEVGQFHDLTKKLGVPDTLRARPATLGDQTIRGIISELSGVMGEDLIAERRGATGAGELMFKLPGERKALFTLPEAFGVSGMEKGLVRTGAGLHNIYAPGLFATIDETGELGKSMTFTEYKARQMLDAAKAAHASGVSVEAAIATRSEEIGKFMDFVEPSLTGDDFSIETVMRGQRLTVLDDQGRPVTGLRAQRLLERQGGKLFPTGTPGRFSLLDPAEIYGGFSESIDYSRKPWQWIKDYRPSAAAQKAIMESEFGTKQFDFLDSPLAIKQFKGPSGPRLKTLYLSDDQIGQLRNLGFPVGDGELLVNNKFNNQAEVTRRRRVALKEVTDEVLAKFAFTEKQGGLPDVSNLMLGRTETGDLLTGGAMERVVGREVTTLKGPGGTKVAGLNLLLEETIPMGEWEKKFGGLKGMARTVDFGELAARAAELPPGTIPFHPSEIASFGAIGRLSDLQKDPATLQMQQFSALVREMDIEDPTNVLHRIRASGDVNRELRDLAARGGILPGTRAFEEIFGEQAVYGISRLHFGGPKEFTGAGGLGTIEPRILALLQGRGGGFGQELGEDLVSRLMIREPERLALHHELRKTFASLAEDAATPAGVDLRHMSTAEVERFRREGGYLATGIKEAPSVYIPGTDIAPSLRPYGVGERKTLDSPVAKTLREIENLSRATLSGTISQEVAMQKLTGREGLLTDLYQEFAPAGKGEAALARGKVFGSRFLTAVSGRSEFYEQVAKLGLEESQVIGIPREIGEQMIQELAEHHVDVGDMAERFRRGEAIGGAVARHPFIGPYSMQPVKMLAVDAAEPVMFVPEKSISLRFKGIGEEVVTGGILQGLALDKDADIPMAIAVNQEMEMKIRDQLAKSGTALNQQLESYAHHNVRMQLMKAKVFTDIGEANIAKSEQIAAAATKLGITDEYVGRVSTQLTKARQAVISSTLDESSQLRALGMLEWLEQQPISGKHLSTQKVLAGAFQKQMEAIISGAAGDANLMKNTINEMLHIETTGITNPEKMAKARKRQALIQGLLSQGLELEQDVVMNGHTFSRIEGFDVDRTTRQIAEAVRSFETERIGNLTQSQVERFMKPGQFAQLSREQIAPMLEATDIMSTPQAKGFRQAQQAVMSSINRAMGEVTSRVKPFAKPIMLGLAAASGAAFLASGPPSVMPAPEEVPSTLGRDRVGLMSPPVAQIRNGARDNIAIPEVQQQILGEPTAPNPIPQRTISLDEKQFKSLKDIRMRINAESLTAQQRAQLTNTLSSRFPGTVDVNIRDSRRMLNQHTIADMMD